MMAGSGNLPSRRELVWYAIMSNAPGLGVWLVSVSKMSGTQSVAEEMFLRSSVRFLSVVSAGITGVVFGRSDANWFSKLVLPAPCGPVMYALNRSFAALCNCSSSGVGMYRFCWVGIPHICVGRQVWEQLTGTGGFENITGGHQASPMVEQAVSRESTKAASLVLLTPDQLRERARPSLRLYSYRVNGVRNYLPDFFVFMFCAGALWLCALSLPLFGCGPF